MLYAAPLEDFIPERKRQSAALRDAGEPAAAAELAAIAKPTPAAWAVNFVARAAPGAVERWAASAAMLRDASANPKATGADGLRAAMAAHRASTAALADEIHARAKPGGRPLSPAMLDRAVAILHAAVAATELSDRVVAGWVTEDRARPAPPPPKRAAPDADAAPTPKIDRRQKELGRLEAVVAEREADAKVADERLLEAGRRMRRMESEAAAAHHALDEVREKLRRLQEED